MPEKRMSAAEKKAAIDAAWAEYRAASIAIPLQTPYSGNRRGDGFLEIDERLWKCYLAAEARILKS
jgi:hypothetical protein